MKKAGKPKKDKSGAAVPKELDIFCGAFYTHGLLAAISVPSFRAFDGDREVFTKLGGQFVQGLHHDHLKTLMTACVESLEWAANSYRKPKGMPDIRVHIPHKDVFRMLSRGALPERRRAEFGERIERAVRGLGKVSYHVADPKDRRVKALVSLTRRTCIEEAKREFEKQLEKAKRAADFREKNPAVPVPFDHRSKRELIEGTSDVIKQLEKEEPHTAYMIVKALQYIFETKVRLRLADMQTVREIQHAADLVVEKMGREETTVPGHEKKAGIEEEKENLMFQ